MDKKAYYICLEAKKGKILRFKGLISEKERSSAIVWHQPILYLKTPVTVDYYHYIYVHTLGNQVQKFLALFNNQSLYFNEKNNSL